MIKIKVNRQVGKKCPDGLIDFGIHHLEGSAKCDVSLGRRDMLVLDDLMPFSVSDLIFALKDNINNEGGGSLG